ncbi:DUF2334 domain-containing protein [Caldimonas tepidiphila]|uniref:DUF2334 domain-containing protein n=1 Tax=Caldimonas tepidiphila TaxID=2315841 RepID=UPI000E5B29B2|nr:polysaccharide deacetylase family protein [Caldimonas tepidiphila]
MKPGLSVVLHDVAPATALLCRRLIDAVHEVAPLPMTLLAVPRYHHQDPDAGFDHWLGERLDAGDELALHGYTHWDDGEPDGWIDHLRRRVYTASEGEFSALSCAQATLRLAAGMRWFERNHWPLHGFVAPAWLLSEGSWKALRTMPLRYTCTLRELVPLQRGSEPLVSQSVVYSTRSAWRRALSRLWNPAVVATQRHRPLLRFELHPHDVEHATVRRSWQRLLARHLEAREPLTLAQATLAWQQRGRGSLAC